MRHTTTPEQPTRRDRSLLRQTLWKLTAVHKLVCTVVVVLVGLAWVWAARRLLAFGETVDYSGLTALGVQAVALIKQYNPFFWWGLVVLCTLIIAYFLKLFVRGSRRQAMARLVSAATVETLAGQLTQPAIDVLNWAWSDRRQPVSVGVIQRAVTEMGGHRAAKIALARRHSALLGNSDPVPPGLALPQQSAVVRPDDGLQNP